MEKETIEILVNAWWFDTEKDGQEFEIELNKLLPELKFGFAGNWFLIERP